MKQLLLVQAPGLAADQAVRGDVAWNLSDLIADGSFARMSAPADPAAAAAALPAGQVRHARVPYQDAASFDAELGKLREGAAGAAIAVLSEQVFVSGHYFREIKPGATLAPADLPALLAAMVR